MVLLLRKLVEGYNYVFYDLQDARTRDWWPNLIALLIILTSYYYFCISLGPRIMKHRKPYELKNVMLLYNSFQVIISIYMLFKGISHIKWNFLYCKPVDYSENLELKEQHFLAWIYLIVKFIDLLDTVFFVLRKKFGQISGLHLYHHTLMPAAIYIGFKYYPNGHGVFMGLINTFVHIIMYTYYLIAGLGPKFQKYLWWKRYVTVLQLVQFVLIFLQNLAPLLIGCDYPKWVNIGLCINSALFVYLFGSFYRENYVKKDRMNNGCFEKKNK
ncbi:hypothetical protein K1T71_004729 [Dendrolimus kikuchii]|uniref:Uncharacterized protein n=1 Tax=Dendrolimus kikuchii TaxID=765133 RepID=A0ACC1D899_9NEOP|nr:hypothetical protein K1T71_004729 [Dendrolimus kikuchii]